MALMETKFLLALRVSPSAVTIGKFLLPTLFQKNFGAENDAVHVPLLIIKNKRKENKISLHKFSHIHAR
jgi:hypothetical protein